MSYYLTSGDTILNDHLVLAYEIQIVNHFLLKYIAQKKTINLDKIMQKKRRQTISIDFFIMIKGYIDRLNKEKKKIINKLI